ncbi:MAG: molybdopterin-dependent oxidoreductase, partial [Pseudomonadales bacterium]
MTEEHLTFCRICESLCGLKVAVDQTAAGPQVIDIRPDSDHVATGGFACPKGLRQQHLFDNPDRLRVPRMKTAEGWQDASWDTALTRIGEQLAQIRRDHGGDAIGMYVGTAAGFSVLHPVFAQGMMDGLGSRNMFASATQDCANKFAVAQRMYGFPFTQPFPDLLQTQCLIIVGANPMVSKWSFLQVPNPRSHINAIKDRGGRVIVVDPRETETAKAAGEHLFIKPGTDAYFYLGFLQELIATDGVDHERVRAHYDGFEAIAAVANAWTPERCEPLTGISAAALRDLVKTYSTANGAALYCSTGVNMSAQGTLAFYLQEVINAVSGNLDRSGGTLVGQGIFDFARFGKKYGLLVKEDRSRVGNFRKTNDAFPGGILADEILTPGKGQIRALIVTGGNPLLTMTDSDKLRRAFESLELLITLDIQPNETGMSGHFMLPCTSPLERPDLPFIFPLTLGMQTRPYLQATNAVLPPPGEARDEATIYTDLARAAHAPLFGSRIFQTLMQWSKRRRNGDRYKSVAQTGLLNLLLKLSGQPSFKKLLGHGWLRHQNIGGTLLGKRIYTNAQGTGRVQLAPTELLERAQALAEPEPSAAFTYQLITKRQVETHNSWTHNYPAFLERLNGRNYLYMHPGDAERENLNEGAMVAVRSDNGAIALPMRLCPEIMAGVVAVPHGWGHQNSGQRAAAAAQGVNVNLLASSGVDHVDTISGMSQLTALSVTVTAL